MHDDARQREEMAEVMRAHEATHRLNLERRAVVREALDAMRAELMLPAAELLARQETLIRTQADLIDSLTRMVHAYVSATTFSPTLEETELPEAKEGGTGGAP